MIGTVAAMVFVFATLAVVAYALVHDLTPRLQRSSRPR